MSPTFPAKFLCCYGAHRTNELCSLAYITDEVAFALTNALVNNSSLRELRLCDNPDVTAAGWASFSFILRIPHSALKVINLGGNRINDNAMMSFADALANNIKLKRLYISLNPVSGYSDSGITSNGLASFTHLMCDTPSVLSTYHSNHTLEMLGHGVCDDEKLP